MLWLFLGVLFFFLFLGVPAAFSMLLSAIAMMLAMGNYDTQIVAQNLVNGANNFPLMAIPFFILAGEIMNAGGISKRIIHFASTLVGHIRGGLGYVTVIAGLIFAGLSGSAVADTAALGAILIPMMANKGYNVRRATGLVASSGLIAPIMPPSIGLIMYGVIGGVSITQLFMAGIVPAVIFAVGLSVVWYIFAKKDNLPTTPKATNKERLDAFLQAIWALVLPFIIIFGIRGGIFTPTEAAVVAAVYALVISLTVYRKEFKISQIPQVFVNTVKTTGVVMFLAASAMVSAWVITVAQVPAELGAFISGLTDNPTIILLLVMVMLLLVGTVMDMTPAILIFTPVLLPVVQAAGIDPVFFGVLMIINLTIGLITPPVGTVLFVAAGISKLSIVDVTKGIWPFLLMYVIILLLLALFPQIILTPLEWLL